MIMTGIHACRTLPWLTGNAAHLQIIFRAHSSKTFMHAGYRSFSSSPNHARFQTPEPWTWEEHKKVAYQNQLRRRINAEIKAALSRHPELRNHENSLWLLDESRRLFKLMGEDPAASMEKWPKQKLLDYYKLELKLIDFMTIQMDYDTAVKDLEYCISQRKKASEVIYLLENGNSFVSRAKFQLMYKDKASRHILVLSLALFGSLWFGDEIVIEKMDAGEDAPRGFVQCLSIWNGKIRIFRKVMQEKVQEEQGEAKSWYSGFFEMPETLRLVTIAVAKPPQNPQEPTSGLLSRED